MLKAIREAYGTAGRALWALPVIAAIPFVAEAVQHIVEWRVGMFSSFDGMSAAEADPARLATGHFKTAALFLVTFWAYRFVAFGRDPRATLRWDARAALLFVPVLAFGALTSVAHMHAGPALAAIVPAGGALMAAGFALFFLAIALELYLAVWKLGAATGDVRLNPLASIRIMRGHVAWGFTFSLAVIMPTMVVHYALNAAAVGQAPLVQFAVLAIDCLVVAYLAMLLPTGVAVLARRALAAEEARTASGVPVPALALTQLSSPRA